ncbi:MULTISPECIES: hypothetical protein [unclassified Nocardioides]|uniref:hypothetical protein n=1 Tax=unclassified Nocardioides TaxID=2615069 RepID=UPI0007014E82|nr:MULTISPECIES: hypothetical protein [unclassified Nocardioides]KRA30985.1 hypothetical protein ASD81_15920 [Nocardioides sp. Root614]KRA87606.1 hypothetical protein ASD84_16195 [Nocardioides sp. Root682]
MPHLTVRQVMVLAGCVLALATFSIGVYGLVRGPADTTAPTPTRRPAEAEVTARANDPAATLQHRALLRTTDPIAYARAVAESLFTWDTSTGFLPTDYTSAVLADADPSGEETPGLLADVAAYLPTVEQWLDLSAMGVAQRIDIVEAFVPESWDAAEDQAHGRLLPGTTAVTISGTRHRSGMWNGEVAASSYPVSFTIFLACQPAFERCHVLRLSQLDNPLR